jgi:hypothetical protein
MIAAVEQRRRRLVIEAALAQAREGQASRPEQPQPGPQPAPELPPPSIGKTDLRCPSLQRAVSALWRRCPTACLAAGFAPFPTARLPAGSAALLRRPSPWAAALKNEEAAAHAAARAEAEASRPVATPALAYPSPQGLALASPPPALRALRGLGGLQQGTSYYTPGLGDLSEADRLLVEELQRSCPSGGPDFQSQLAQYAADPSYVEEHYGALLSPDRPDDRPDDVQRVAREYVDTLKVHDAQMGAPIAPGAILPLGDPILQLDVAMKALKRQRSLQLQLQWPPASLPSAVEAALDGVLRGLGPSSTQQRRELLEQVWASR